jgi:uncharacterized RDD family membrane protein YckC
MNETVPHEDLLGEAQFEWQNEDATTGQRFVNYIVDIISFYIAIFLAAVVVAAIVPGGEEFIASLDNSPAILDRLFSLIFYGIYMAVIEGLFKGRTLGKLITRTKAVHEDGESLNWAKAFTRGLSRMVPFEPFSALGRRPWHDTWTNTRVIKLRR